MYIYIFTIVKKKKLFLNKKAYVQKSTKRWKPRPEGKWSCLGHLGAPGFLPSPSLPTPQPHRSTPTVTSAHYLLQTVCERIKKLRKKDVWQISREARQLTRSFKFPTPMSFSPKRWDSRAGEERDSGLVGRQVSSFSEVRVPP